MTTRVTEGARRESFFSSRTAAFVSRNALARVHSFTKSEEKGRLLAVLFKSTLKNEKKIENSKMPRFKSLSYYFWGVSLSVCTESRESEYVPVVSLQ